MSWKTKTIDTLVLLWLFAFALGFVAYPLLGTHVTEEDIDLILDSLNILPEMMGFNIKTLLVPHNSWIELQILGTATIGVLG
jgi:hypothetical protein